MRPSSSITSPRLTPIRNTIRRFSGSFCIPRLELVLGCHRALDRIHYTPKLGQEIVPWRVYDSVHGAAESGPHDFPIGGESSDSLSLILAMRRLYPFTSALRIAVSLRLNSSAAIGSPPKRKSPQKDIQIPWRLRFQNLLVAFFHGRLQKVRVMLKVYRKTELFGN